MVGAAVLAFTYLPRLAVNDGIQYYLDYYPRPTPSAHNAVLTILNFYAICREVIRRGELVIVPRRFWTDARFDPEVAQASDDVAMRSVESRLEHLSAFDWPIPRGSLEDMAPPGKKAGHYAWVGLRQTREILSFCSRTGYSPLLDTPPRQLSFDALIERVPEGVRPRAIPAFEHADILVPMVRNIPLNELLDARASKGFEEFRNCVSDIGRLSADISAPLELREAIADRLQAGKKLIEAEFATSAIIRKTFKDVVKLGIGAVTGSSVAGSINPSWAADPWKLVLLGSVAAVADLGMSIPQMVKRKHVSRLLAKVQVAP
jgi:hypothetical protein